ncbi:MAG: endonuclease/exonuclease/phosphatase family protein [Pseudomonadota bacterium]
MNLLTIAAAALGASAGPGLTIDGRFEDWADTPEVAEALGDAPPVLDLGPARWRLDQHGLWLQLNVAQPGNLVHAPRTLSIALDYTDGGRDYRNTAGIDRVLELSPRQRSGQYGTRVLTPGTFTWEEGPASTVGLRSGPTWSSNSYELLLRDPEWTTDSARVTVSLWQGKEEDRIDTFSVQRGQPSRPPKLPSLGRAPGTSFRVLQWNAGGEGTVPREAEFTSLLRAAEADIVLLDEVWPTQTAGFLTEFPYQHLGSSGGRQRGMVLSRFPIEPAAAFERLSYTQEALDVIRREGTGFMRNDLKNAVSEGIAAAGVRVRLGEVTVLFVALDLQCCGSDGSVEDRFREMQAARILKAIDETRGDEGFDHLIVGGDFNLVGSRRPLELFLNTAPLPLSAVDWLQPNGLSNVTWIRDGNEFPPGRLDFTLHDAGLKALKGIILNPQVMTENDRARFQLVPDLVFRMSGHVPIITDFAFEDTSSR